jgi:hypothetical protein
MGVGSSTQSGDGVTAAAPLLPFAASAGAISGGSSVENIHQGNVDYAAGEFGGSPSESLFNLREYEQTMSAKATANVINHIANELGDIVVDMK